MAQVKRPRYLPLLAAAALCIVAVDATRAPVAESRACDDAYIHRLTSAVEHATGRTVRVPSSLMPCADPGRRRTVTFAVPPITLVGGFGDRLLGMVTAFYAALATDAEFGVDWARPYPLSTYFEVPCASTAPPGAVAVDAIDVWTHFAEYEYRSNGRDVVYHTNARHWGGVVNASTATGLIGSCRQRRHALLRHLQRTRSAAPDSGGSTLTAGTDRLETLLLHGKN
jgi:hypothetical protein